jgi:hypothetical protein
MKKISSSVFYMLLLMVVFLFASCEKDGVTSIRINKTTLSQNVGRVDTITATVNFTGELSKLPATWSVSDTNIVSIVSELKGAAAVSNSESSIEKLLVIKAKKSGTAKVTLTVDGKTIDCDVTVIMRKFTFTKIIANNYGDFYDIGTNNFEMLLYESTMSLNSEGRLTGDGNFLVLDYNAPLTQNSFLTGDFTASEYGEANTFIPGLYDDESENFYFSIFANSKNNVRTFSLISGGSYKVTSTASGFSITGELLLEDGEVIQIEYSGAVNVEDMRDAEEVKPTLTHGLLYYYGDFYKTTKSNNLSVYLASASLNFTDTATKGDILALEVNVPLTVTDSLPNGTYNFVNFPQNMTALPISDFVPFTLVPPFYDADSNEYGSWFYGEENTKKLKTGSINVTKTGAKSYQITYEFYDRFGAKVSGTFNGNLEYTDKTKPASGVKMAKVPSKLKGRFEMNSKINTIINGKDKSRISHF